MEPVLNDLLQANLAVLGRLDEADDHDDKLAAAERFVDAHLELGQALARAPELRWEPEVIDYLQATTPVVGRNLTFLASHPDDTRRILGLPFEHDEWRRVVERRSAFEFLKELYADSDLADRLAAIDVTELDERLRFVGEREGHLGPGDIPSDIPPSHWWWWAPAAPPAADDGDA